MKHFAKTGSLFLALFAVEVWAQHGSKGPPKKTAPLALTGHITVEKGSLNEDHFEFVLTTDNPLPWKDCVFLVPGKRTMRLDYVSSMSSRPYTDSSFKADPEAKEVKEMLVTCANGAAPITLEAKTRKQRNDEYCKTHDCNHFQEYSGGESSSPSSSSSSQKAKACAPKGGSCKFRSDCCSGPCKANYTCGG